MRLRRSARFAASFWLIAATAGANDASARLRAQASEELYNLDLDRAAAIYREAIAADPADATAHRGLRPATRRRRRRVPEGDRDGHLLQQAALLCDRDQDGHTADETRRLLTR